MPATSHEPSGRFASRSGFYTGGSGRRKRVSARHQVKRLDRPSGNSFFGKPVRQKKQVFFVRCGSTVRNFTGAETPIVKSDPDVFADALVPPPAAEPPGEPVSRSPASSLWMFTAESRAQARPRARQDGMCPGRGAALPRRCAAEPGPVRVPANGPRTSSAASGARDRGQWLSLRQTAG